MWDGKIVVWKTFGDDDVNKKYEGEIKNGKPNGLGILTSPYGDKHVGGWKKGKEHGQGTYTHPDGNKYVGGWKVGKRHGQGTMTFSSGDKYVEGWKDDKKMDKEQTLRLMEESMKENGRLEKDMVKGH